MYEWPSIYQVDFSKPPACYWSNKYSDGIFYQLVDMIKEYGWKEYRKTTYYYAMHDFDASTGFNIPSRLTKYDRNYLTQIAQQVHQQWVNDGKKIYK